MLYLKNNLLKVSIIDPRSDQERMGPRFCSGVHVWQIEKKDRGPLLSGPFYPEPDPPVSDGQGLPEVFQPALIDSSIRDGDPTLVMGVGEVAYHSDITIMRRRTSVISFCDWEVDPAPDSILMIARQKFHPWSFNLVRNVLLIDNHLDIATIIQNSSDRDLPFRWFAHPFFQLPGAGACARLLFDATLSQGNGFRLTEDGMLFMDGAPSPGDDYYQTFKDVFGETLKATIYHPSGCTIRIAGAFPMSKTALWANDKTFSIEPFFERKIAPGRQISWNLVYTFR